MTDNDYQQCYECSIPAQHLSAAGLCCSCQWMADKDALCAECSHAEIDYCEEAEIEGGHCLAGGHHCIHYHHHCDMMDVVQPVQLDMFGG